MRLLACLTAILLLASPVAAADFQKGVAAYNRGDYATAMKEWRPLAEQAARLPGDLIVDRRVALIVRRVAGVWV